MLSYDARTVDTVWNPQAACTASANPASAGHTVRTSRGVRWPAKMEESASKTVPIHLITAATVPCTSLDDTVRTNRPALICSVSSIQGIKCVTISVTTTNASGMEGTALSTGSSRGSTAPPTSPAGIALRTDVVIKSATTPDASLTALSARKTQKPSAST